MLTPVVYGHRGASAAAPENTVAAFGLARDLGADGVELDVRRSADDVLVLHHDPELRDGRLIRATRHRELPAAVPTLSEALDACEGMIVNIEIKNIPFEPDFDPELVIADAVVALLVARTSARSSAQTGDRVLVSSFHLPTIDRVRLRSPETATGLLTLIDPLPMAGLAVAAARGHGAIHPYDLTVDESLVAAAREAGIAVNVWTVDDPARIADLAAMGVDGIVTNVPDVARRVLDG